mgnify:CR=1 FL=1
MTLNEARDRQIELFKAGIFTKIEIGYVDNNELNYILIDCDQFSSGKDMVHHAAHDIRRRYQKTHGLRLIKGGNNA